jgi:protein disulfide-isomerase
LKKPLLTRLLFLLIFAFPLAVSSLGAAESNGYKSISWTTNYNEALTRSKQEGKPVLLFFTGSDWCGWCTQLQREVLNTESFYELANDRYIFVEVDFPKKKSLSSNVLEQNKFLAKKYHITSYPTIVVVDSSGSTLGESGYKSGGAEKYAAHLDSIVAPHLAKFKSPTPKAAEVSVEISHASELSNLTSKVSIEGSFDYASGPVVSQQETVVLDQGIVKEQAVAIEETKSSDDALAAQVDAATPELVEVKAALEAEVLTY